MACTRVLVVSGEGARRDLGDIPTDVETEARKGLITHLTANTIQHDPSVWKASSSLFHDIVSTCSWAHKRFDA